MIRACSLSLLVCFASLVSQVFAQDASSISLPSDPEDVHRLLRNDSDRRVQLLGDRWYGLIKLQEWTDATGKYSVDASYVAHDPNLQWVKLLVVDTSDPLRSEREVQVETSKLSVTSQARVRRIRDLRERLPIELARARQAEADAEAEEQQNGIGGSGPPPSFGGSGPPPASSQPTRSQSRPQPQTPFNFDEPAISPPAGQTPPSSRPASQPVASSPSGGPPGAEPPGAAPSGAAAAVASGTAGEVPAGLDGAEAEVPPQPARNEPWRTDHTKFFSNISVTDGRVDWGELDELAAIYEEYLQDPTATEAIEEQLKSVGEARWRLRTAGQMDPSSYEMTFAIPSVKNFDVTFTVDAEKDRAMLTTWSSVPPGLEGVFACRFTGFEEDGIKIMVHAVGR